MVTSLRICAGSKKRTWEARKVAIYCLKRFTGLTNAQIGKEFGIGDSAVSKAAGDFERLMREKPEAEKRMRKSNFQFQGLTPAMEG